MSEKPDDLRAQMLRILAANHRRRAAQLDMAAAALEAARPMKKLVDLLTEAEAREVAEHPDLAELNAQLEGYYGTT
ncbi:hypothetical protein ACIPEL_36275 [Streptomyces griseoviridis]